MNAQTVVPVYTMFGVRLTKREYNFLEGLRRGLPPAAAAAEARYSNPASTCAAIMRRPHVADVVAHIQAEFSRDLQITRRDVLAKLEDAYSLAESLEKPETMVRATSELCKIMGYYAPEKRHVVSEKAGAIDNREADAFAVGQMADDELERLAAGEADSD